MQINYSNFLEFIVSNRWKSKSQISQDLFVLYFTQQKKDGYFIEIGACDGWRLEKGICYSIRGYRLDESAKRFQYAKVRIRRRSTIQRFN